MTFVATLNTIVHCGARPVLADIDAATLNVRVEEIEKRLSPRHEGDPAGPLRRPAGGPRSDPRARRRRGIAVLEDAAHAVGAEYKGRRIGSFPTTSVFSFHPNKNMTTGKAAWS